MRTSCAWAFASVALLSVVSVAGQGGTSLSGRLTAAGSPLSDCAISLYRLQAPDGKYVENIVTRTTGDGSYRFDSLVPSAYILLGTCGGQRVFQGRLQIQPGPNLKNISLADPFSGRWKLDLSQSTMGEYSRFRDEVREYQRTGSTTTMSWSRTDTTGKQTKGSYKLVCDGAEYPVSGQRMTCRFVGPDTVEGYQKPPLSYYVRKVSGNTLTIDSYRDPARTKLASRLVYTRIL